ncbi:hypothetical protein ILUMI_14917 [Ignelater luminosus]|uniref:Uncharacterized protein n=1 Tax=Ignelater luminosus TaxID=2038154 RepID=A0A8K0GA16_IGNLU|nr:hypothetical protein ILUMI_14917 [Ignelater luminosus]
MSTGSANLNASVKGARLLLVSSSKNELLAAQTKQTALRKMIFSKKATKVIAKESTSEEDAIELAKSSGSSCWENDPEEKLEPQKLIEEGFAVAAVQDVFEFLCCYQKSVDTLL